LSASFGAPLGARLSVHVLRVLAHLSSLFHTNSEQGEQGAEKARKEGVFAPLHLCALTSCLRGVELDVEWLAGLLQGSAPQRALPPALEEALAARGPDRVRARLPLLERKAFVLESWREQSVDILGLGSAQWVLAAASQPQSALKVLKWAWTFS
jgi:hypothetical protein